MKGVNMGGRENKLLLYADNILLLSNPQLSISPLLDLVNALSEISGYKVNWTKYKVMPLSKHCLRNDLLSWRFQ
jgi:hypothetical protein